MTRPEPRFERINIGPFQVSDADLDLQQNPRALSWSKNISLESEGWPKQRPGYTSVTSSVHASFPASGINKGWFFLSSNGNRNCLVYDPTTFIYYGTSYTALTSQRDPTWTTVTDVTMTVFDKVAYFSPFSSSASNVGQSYDGSSWTALSDLGAAGGSSGYYRAFTSCVAHERVFLGAVYEGTTLYGNRIRFSDPASATDWTATGYIDLPLDKGGQIIALVPYENAILIFREYDIYVLSGRSEDSFQIYRLTDEYGMQREMAWATYGGNLYFADYQNGLVFFDGEEFNVVRWPNGDDLSYLSTYAEDVSVNVWDDKILFNTGNTNNLAYCYHPESGTLTKWLLYYDWAINGIAFEQDQLYIYYPDSINTSADRKRLFKLADWATDDGDYVAPGFETAWIYSENRERFKVVRLEFDYFVDYGTISNTANEIIKINAYIDSTYDLYGPDVSLSGYPCEGSDSWRHAIIDYDFTESVTQAGTDPVGRGARSVKLYFRNNIAASVWQVKKFAVRNIVLTVSVDDTFHQDERADWSVV